MLVLLWLPLDQPDPRNMWFFLTKTYISADLHFSHFSAQSPFEMIQKAPKGVPKTEVREKEVASQNPGAHFGRKLVRLHAGILRSEKSG